MNVTIQRRLNARPELTADGVRSIRKSCGLSQRRFAEYMGVSTPTVAKWESGIRRPGASARVLLLIASADNLGLVGYVLHSLGIVEET